MLAVKALGAALVCCIVIFAGERFLVALKLYSESFDRLNTTVHQIELTHAALTAVKGIAAVHKPEQKIAPPKSAPRLLVVYSYFETDEAKKNLQFFLRHALHSKADFIFMMNSDYTVTFPSPLPANVRIISRENTCYDLGGFHEILSANATLTTHYQRFILMNASVRGPFFPSWASGACWSDAYLAKLNTRTKLVGMTWNCVNGAVPYPAHIQSMLLAVDNAGMDILLKNFKCYDSFQSAIGDGETQIATWFRESGKGYDVATMEARYWVHAGREGSSSRFLDWCTAEGNGGGEDVWHSGYYEGTTLHPYDTIFVKTNRDWNENDRRVIDNLSKHSDLQGYSSYERCV